MPLLRSLVRSVFSLFVRLRGRDALVLGAAVALLFR
jgi:hypothetical protein